ncbi:MAG: UDP-N-acetylmuramate--L-alanine ligase, partial [Ruminococcus sp.]|nr:UDP-N-acetylmuramate--L-alanine ligase [Ruminococcus sp.]
IEGCIWFPQDETKEWDDERKYFNFAQICDYVCDNAKEGDLVITLGCGDAYKIAKMILQKLKDRKD